MRSTPRRTSTGGRPARRRAPRRRALHPWAWWVWALSLAGVAGSTTNPVVLVLVVAVLASVVAARRLDTPWARAFPLYLALAAFVIVFRMVMHVLVGLKHGEVLVLPLPTVTLPDWAAGISVLGPVWLEGLLGAALTGARLAVILVAVGAANSLANPRRLVRALPSALGEIGTSLVIAVTVAPQLVESVFRVHRARALRGDRARGVRAFGRTALPVLQDTLDRSLRLASSMDARGYGRRATVPARERRMTATLTLTGLGGACVGTYVALDGSLPAAVGVPLLLAGLATAASGLALAGRRRTVSTYRRDPWGRPEWLTVTCGAAALAATLLAAHLDPAALAMPLSPMSAPDVPLLVLAGLTVAALPVVLTPVPPPAAARRPRRGAPRTREAVRA